MIVFSYTGYAYIFVHTIILDKLVMLFLKMINGM